MFRVYMGEFSPWYYVARQFDLSGDIDEPLFIFADGHDADEEYEYATTVVFSNDGEAFFLVEGYSHTPNMAGQWKPRKRNIKELRLLYPQYSPLIEWLGVVERIVSGNVGLDE